MRSFGRSPAQLQLTRPVIRQGVRGIETNAVWVDEVGDTWTIGRNTITPPEITCKSCGAEPGQQCTKTHRRGGKTRYLGYHYRRKDDARLATQAVQALNPR